MNTISDNERAEAQAMSEVFLGRDALGALSDNGVRRWLVVRDHVLAAHECPTVPVWRPTSADEIQEGWEVRSRRPDGSEAGWGIAHHRDEDGDWRTEADTILTFATLRWASETTAPAPEPEPRVEALAQALHDEHCQKAWPCESNADYYRKRARKVLASFNDLMEQPSAPSPK